jgi:hypothetical protein
MWSTVSRNLYYLVREVADGVLQGFVSTFRDQTCVDTTSLSAESNRKETVRGGMWEWSEGSGESRQFEV